MEAYYGKTKKDGININYYIRKDIKEKLDNYCLEVGQTNTMAIERILEHFLLDYEQQKKEGEKKEE